MAMKLVLVAVVVAALSQGTEQNCQTRRDKITHHKMRKTTMCHEPKERLVQIQVPDGFDYVEPRVVMLKQCTGLSCNGANEQCIPRANSTTKHTYRVNAHVKDGPSQCEEVTVEEHHACECGCDEKDCPTNQLFNSVTCECECDPLAEEVCGYRRAMYDHRVMWYRDTCSCACDPSTYNQCDSSMEWDPSMCSCVTKHGNTID